MIRIRALTFEERCRWGRCPICRAADGRWCDGAHREPIGLKTDGTRLLTGEGAHVARISASPERVREVPA